MDNSGDGSGGGSSDGGEDPCTTPQLQRMGSGGSNIVLDPETSVEAESRKLPSSQYKGVARQPNGCWGAQIYEKHQRVWLDTFDSETAIARSYDVAAQHFRAMPSPTSSPSQHPNPSDAAELEFLARHSKAEVVDMLRKHIYADELRQGRRTLISTDNSSYYSNDKTAAQLNSIGGRQSEQRAFVRQDGDTGRCGEAEQAGDNEGARREAPAGTAGRRARESDGKL